MDDFTVALSTSSWISAEWTCGLSYLFCEFPMNYEVILASSSLKKRKEKCVLFYYSVYGYEMCETELYMCYYTHKPVAYMEYICIWTFPLYWLNTW